MSIRKTIAIRWAKAMRWPFLTRMEYGKFKGQAADDAGGDRTGTGSAFCPRRDCQCDGSFILVSQGLSGSKPADDDCRGGGGAGGAALRGCGRAAPEYSPGTVCHYADKSAGCHGNHPGRLVQPALFGQKSAAGPALSVSGPDQAPGKPKAADVTEISALYGGRGARTAADLSVMGRDDAEAAAANRADGAGLDGSYGGSAAGVNPGFVWPAGIRRGAAEHSWAAVGGGNGGRPAAACL